MTEQELRERVESLERQLAEANGMIVEQSKVIADLAREASSKRLAPPPNVVREAIPGRGGAVSPWSPAARERQAQMRRAPEPAPKDSGSLLGKDVEHLFDEPHA